jgi:hypothetical protein
MLWVSVVVKQISNEEVTQFGFFRVLRSASRVAVWKHVKEKAYEEIQAKDQVRRESVAPFHPTDKCLFKESGQFA